MKAFSKLKTAQVAQAAVIALSTIALASGCCSTKSHAQGSGAPAGGTGTPTATESGTAAQGGSTVIPLYQEQVAVGTRQVPAGTVRLHKSVKTETYNQPIQLQHETVTVERMPAGAANPPPTGRSEEPGKTFQDQDVVIQLYKQEPVVQKQLVPAGQVVAKKQSQNEQMNIQEQVRREEIQVSGGGTNVQVSPNLNAPTAAGAPSSGREETSGSESDHK